MFEDTKGVIGEDRTDNIQWPKNKGLKDKQWSTKHYKKTKYIFKSLWDNS